MSQNKCEYSKISIPNDEGYIEPVLTYVRAVAEKIGFADQDLQDIARGLELTLSFILFHAFEPGETAVIDISCERVPRGLQLTLHDKGMPVDAGMIMSPMPENITTQPSGTDQKGRHLKAYLDEVSLHNLGPEGKEIVLVKFLKDKSVTDYYDACELSPFVESRNGDKDQTEKIPFEVRPMRPSDALEVSRCIYKTYGYTYPHDYVYYPEKIVELNEQGRIYSVVAVTPSGEIAGHCALNYHAEGSVIAEMTQGVVKPEFRSMDCFTLLTDALIEKAVSQDLMGIYSEPVTNHTYSQRTGHKYGLKDCGISLGLIPSSTRFKRMAERPVRRISLLLQFRYLKTTGLDPVYAPPHHMDMISRLYGNLESPVSVSPAEKSDLKDKQPIFSIRLIGSMNHARIEVSRFGKDAFSHIERELKELCLKKVEVIQLSLDLSDPVSGCVVSDLETLGFFFAGILPGGIASHDALIMQYLNNVPVNYEEILLESRMARDLLAYVKKLDPNQ